MGWRRLLGILLLVIAVAATWLPTRDGGETAAPTSPVARPDPGYYLRDGTLLGLDSDGRRLYELRATLIRQQPQGRAVLLQELEIDYQANNETPWRLNADAGAIPPDGDTIELTGNVRLRRLDDAGDGALLFTETLAFSARERTAVTDAPVMVRSGDNVLNARGLHADLADGRLELKSAVRGSFRP